MDSIWEHVRKFDEQSLGTVGKRDCSLELEYIKQFLTNVTFSKLFECLNTTSDRDQIRMIRKALERIFSSQIGFTVISNEKFKPFIAAGLQHDEMEIRKLTISQLHDHFGKDMIKDRIEYLEDAVYLDAMVQCIQDEELAVVRHASDVLSEICSIVPQSKTCQVILENIHQNITAEMDSTIRLRYLDVIGRIAGNSDEIFEKCNEIGLLQQFVDQLNCSDPLLLMNLLDLLLHLGNCEKGLEYLFGKGIMNRLVELTTDPFCGSSAIRIIGILSSKASQLHISTWLTENKNVATQFIEIIRNNLNSSDSSTIMGALDALSAFCSGSVSELQRVIGDSRLLQDWLEFGSSSKSDVKAACLFSVANVLSAPTRLKQGENPIVPSDDSLWELNRTIFTKLGDYSPYHSTMELVMYILKQPFEDSRIACFSLLTSVAAQGSKWGLDCLLDYGGFIEFLLNRSTEHSKKTKEWKFAILDAIVSNQFFSSIDNLIKGQLIESFEKGPYLGDSARPTPELDAI